MESDILPTLGLAPLLAANLKVVLIWTLVETGSGNFIHWIPPRQKELSILLPRGLMMYSISLSTQRSLLSI